MGNVIDVRLMQFVNAESPTVARPDPEANVMFVRFQQSENARAPISRTVAGICTLVIFWHTINAASLILRTGRPAIVAGITTLPSYAVFDRAGRAG